VDTASELFFGECCKPSLNQVEPTGRGGREVQVKARPSGQPVADPGGLMGSVVVQDRVNIQLGRYVGFDGAEERAKLLGAMALLGLSDDLAVFVFRAANRLVVPWRTYRPKSKPAEIASFSVKSLVALPGIEPGF
jgi:hypothetical protein